MTANLPTTRAQAAACAAADAKLLVDSMLQPITEPMVFDGLAPSRPITGRHTYGEDQPVPDSNPFLIALPRYRCHKEVVALKIAHVHMNPRGFELHFEDARFVPMQVSVAYVKKHDPVPGGYWVHYEDGYQSYSPAKAFEEGYTLVEAPAHE